MFIKITKTLLDLIESTGIDSELAREAMRFLDLSARLGKHFVFGEVSILRNIRDRSDYYGTKVLATLYSQYSYLSQICNSFQWHAELVSSIYKTYTDDENSVIYISLSDIHRFQLFSETHVIAENHKDVSYFNCILDYYKTKRKLHSVNNCFYPILGGGSTTDKVFLQECKIGRTFVVCITDSDFKYKGSRLGDTASKMNAAVRKAQRYYSQFCYYHYENVSEIENLIPIELLILLESKKGEESKKKMDIIETISKKYPDDYCYLDLKEGISLQTLNKHDDHGILITMVKCINPGIEQQMKEDIEKIKELSAVVKKEEYKKCKYICGLGGSILDEVIEMITNMDLNQLNKVFNDGTSLQQKQEFEMIGKLLYNWTCALPKYRV